jgi:acetylornithine deacetylase/succinyl-diaminopimelate desuccinylase-like protein
MKTNFALFLSPLLIAAFAFPAMAERTNHELVARKMLERVISIDTSITEYGTPEMADYLAGLLRESGFDSEDIRRVELAPNQVSLVVKYPGRDGAAKGVGFMAHMDVVTAFREDWVLDPFTLTEDQGWFIGRGTADNKTGVVGLVATFIKLREAGYQPSRNLWLLLTADEETDMLAIQQLATEMAEEMNLDFAINSDGWSGALAPDGKAYTYYVQGAEKNYQTFEVTVRNPGGHSSAPRSDNAIYQLARALTRIETYRFPHEVNEISAGMLADSARNASPQIAEAIKALLADPADADAAARVSADPQLATVLRTTCVATMLAAGHAENALAQSATATVNCRMLPSANVAEVRAALVKVIDDEEVEVKPQRENTDAPASPMRADVLSAIKYALASRHPDVELVPFLASYGTDGRVLRAAGIPVYGSSGFFMNPEEGFPHGLNEKVPVQGFYDSLEYWERLMRDIGR